MNICDSDFIIQISEARRKNDADRKRRQKAPSLFHSQTKEEWKRPATLRSLRNYGPYES